MYSGLVKRQLLGFETDLINDTPADTAINNTDVHNTDVQNTGEQNTDVHNTTVHNTAVQNGCILIGVNQPDSGGITVPHPAQIHTADNDLNNDIISPHSESELNDPRHEPSQTASVKTCHVCGKQVSLLPQYSTSPLSNRNCPECGTNRRLTASNVEGIPIGSRYTGSPSLDALNAVNSSPCGSV
jgi:hypothetical protein